MTASASYNLQFLINADLNARLDLLSVCFRLHSVHSDCMHNNHFEPLYLAVASYVRSSDLDKLAVELPSPNSFVYQAVLEILKRSIDPEYFSLLFDEADLSILRSLFNLPHPSLPQP